MKLDLSLPLVNERFQIMEGYTLFSFIRDLLAKHEGGNNDKVFDILFAMKKSEEQESHVVELTFSEVDFLIGDLMDRNKTHFAFYKEYVKREIKKQKDSWKDEAPKSTKK